MKYAEIPYIDKKVSRIFYGTAAMPFVTGFGGKDQLDRMVALGINAIDTARGYGGAEIAVGKWLDKRGRRDDMVILTKCCHPLPDGTRRVSPEVMKEELGISLKNLRTDFVDLLLLHRDDPEVEVGPIVETFNELRARGKIRAFGASNWTHTRVALANEYAYKHNLIPFSVSSPNFGLADQAQDPWGGGCVTISGPSNEEARDWYCANQMPVIAYSSLGRGLFSGKLKYEDRDKANKVMDPPAMKGYANPDNFERLRRCEILAEQKGVTVPQIAMAWIYSQKINTFAVVSTSKPERMKSNIEALSISLTPEEAAYLDLKTSEYTLTP